MDITHYYHKAKDAVNQSSRYTLKQILSTIPEFVIEEGDFQEPYVSLAEYLNLLQDKYAITLTQEGLIELLSIILMKNPIQFDDLEEDIVYPSISYTLGLLHKNNQYIYVARKNALLENPIVGISCMLEALLRCKDIKLTILKINNCLTIIYDKYSFSFNLSQSDDILYIIRELNRYNCKCTRLYSNLKITADQFAKESSFIKSPPTVQGF